MLIAGTGVNIAIVGVNQITDVEIDRINKPRLPIAAGELCPRRRGGSSRSRRSCRSCWRSRRARVETGAVVAALAVGAAYSLPPVRLKRYPSRPSLCIAGVRSAT